MLFTNNTQRWPPEGWRDKYEKMKEWKAWYSGESLKLMEFYDSKDTVQNQEFWSTISEGWQDKIHLPLASEISSVSADLLFNEMPEFKIPKAHVEGADRQDKDTQSRLTELLSNNQFHSKLLESAESNSALGGTYLKINWNKDFKNFPIISVAHSDTAIPNFNYDYLTSVTFHKVVKQDGSTVWRKLEKHERGKITNMLYKGNQNHLGKEIPLDSLNKTKNMSREIDTGIDDLLVRYVPNKKPNKLWMDSSLGNSDYQGLEGLLDALDDTYTDWMDEMELAKADKIIPADWLDYDSSSGELKYDPDKTTFTTLDVPPSKMDKPQMIQPDMRTDKYEQTCLNLIERIVSSAGYSPQTFGLEIKGRAESGTALKVREDKSYNTKARKEKHFKQPLEQILELLLKVDKLQFGNNKISDEPNVEVTFKQTSRESPNDQAETIEKLRRAKAMSKISAVKQIHPNWSDQEVKDEVDRILQQEDGE